SRSQRGEEADLRPGEGGVVEHINLYSLTSSLLSLIWSLASSSQIQEVLGNVMKLLVRLVEFFPKALVLAGLLCISQPILAQRARLVGTVRDPSEAVIPGASIRATNSETGLGWEAKSNGRGDYALE